MSRLPMSKHQLVGGKGQLQCTRSLRLATAYDNGRLMASTNTFYTISLTLMTSINAHLHIEGVPANVSRKLYRQSLMRTLWYSSQRTSCMSLCAKMAANWACMYVWAWEGWRIGNSHLTTQLYIPVSMAHQEA
jgi:hypothetical protein